MHAPSATTVVMLLAAALVTMDPRATRAESNDWRVAEVVRAGSMPWGVIATRDAVFVAHVGYKNRDNIWRYDTALKVAAKSRFTGHAVEIVLSPDGKTLYAGNSREDTIVALDAATLKQTGTYATGSGPKDLCISRDGQTLYAGNFNTNTISVVAIGGGKPRTVKVGDGPRGVDLSGDGSKLFVASLRSSTVTVVDTASLAVDKTLRGCRGAAHTALTPDGKTLLVTCYGGKHVQVIDTTKLEATRVVEVGKGPNPIAIAPDGSLAAIGNEFASSVSFIDLVTWQVSTLSVPLERVVGIAFSPDGKRVFVTARGSTKLVVLERSPGSR